MPKNRPCDEGFAQAVGVLQALKRAAAAQVTDLRELAQKAKSPAVVAGLSPGFMPNRPCRRLYFRTERQGYFAG